MKRLIAALVISALAIGICAGGSVITNNFSNELRELIEGSVEACAAEDYALTNEINDEIIKKWEHHSKLLELFSGHANIHIVEQSIAKMSALLEIEDYALYIVECRTAILELENISHSEKMGLANLM